MFAKNLKRVVLVGAALSLALSMISCGGKKDDKKGNDTKTEQTQDKK